MLVRLLRVTATLAVMLVVLCPPSPVAAHDPGCGLPNQGLRYVVIFDAGTPEASAREAIRAACGTTSGYYPQIGVGVATSANPRFAARFGPARAYSARAEKGYPVRAELASPVVVPPTAARLPLRARELGADRSAEQWDMEMIHAPRARAINPGRPEVVVGVLDSGVDATHPDLTGAVDRSRSAGCLSGWPDPSPSAWSPTTSAHGTHIAGTIAAADDGHGVAGVAPGVRVASVKVVDDDGFIYPEYAVCGFMWAARQRMRIANNSYSLDPWLLTCSDVPGQAVAHEALRRAVAYASAAGVLSVAAAGNERTDLADPRQDLHSPNNTPHPRARSVNRHCDVLPAELPGVVAVSAVGAQRIKAGYSSYGAGVVTVTAPGGDSAQRPLPPGGDGCVLSTVPGGYGYACGTSTAAAHVSGVAALLASTRPLAGPQELRALLTQQADPLPCPPEAQGGGCVFGADNGFYGHGLVDALRAVSAGLD